MQYFKKIIFSISIALVFATSVDASSDERAIKHTLLKYNYGIIKMAKTSETDFFKSFVKEEVVEKLMLWVKAWHDNNLVMIASINDFRFGSITYNENNATMQTMENWTYSYINIATKETAHKSENIFYKMNYTLQKQDGKWIIVDIKHLKEEVFTDEKTHNPTLEPKKEDSNEDIATH